MLQFAKLHKFQDHERDWQDSCLYQSGGELWAVLDCQQAHDVHSEDHTSAEKKVEHCEDDDLTLEDTWFVKSCFEFVIAEEEWIVESQDFKGQQPRK